MLDAPTSFPLNDHAPAKSPPVPETWTTSTMLPVFELVAGRPAMGEALSALTADPRRREMLLGGQRQRPLGEVAGWPGCAGTPD